MSSIPDVSMFTSTVEGSKVTVNTSEWIMNSEAVTGKFIPAVA
jgi:hypothetical protein